ncbi:MAG: hypothetical protein LBE25_09430 [Arthrobacter sp.]|jgi:hypothetical protein|nr:hypothetical protein [Arthrobacter sp.]
MPTPSKGDRRPVNIRVPRATHEALQEVKQLTGVDVTDQLAPLVIEYAKRAQAEARNSAPSILAESLMKSA